MGGDNAKILYQYFLQKVRDGYQTARVRDGVFQAMMEVALVNDGPVSRLLKLNPISVDQHEGQVTLEIVVAPKELTAKAP
jgi:hypothetical protein